MSPNKVAIYCRLSRDDGSIDESQSIQSQKAILTEYAIKHNFEIVDVYVDDGYSGTDFNRPSFLRMLNDIELNRINIVITKDLSRLGRNYIQTGYYTEEYFPNHNVRYIAINDNFDTEKTRKAVEMVGGRFETESSGGITFDTLRDYALCGVDFISVGALTHSVKGLDMSFKAVQ